MRSYLVQCHIRVTWDFLGVHVILTWGLTERKNSLPSLSVVFFFGTVQFIRVIALWIHLPVGSIYLDMWFWMSCPFADRPGSTSPGLLASPSDSATPNLTGSVITLLCLLLRIHRPPWHHLHLQAATDTSASLELWRLALCIGSMDKRTFLSFRAVSYVLTSKASL